MKKFLLFIVVSFFCTTLVAQVKMPAQSPAQFTRQEFAIGAVEVKYSRPQRKGRKVFGDLVPFNQTWRTGANAATVIRFTEPVEIRGKKIDSGSYALYTIPNYDSWEIIFNKGINNWGTEGYKESEDVYRFRVEPKRSGHVTENFTIQFENVTTTSCEMQIKWDQTMVAFSINANIQDKLAKQINEALLTDKKPYWEAAQFYNEYDKNEKKALLYATKAVEENPKAYWIWLYKANIEKQSGDKKAALESSKKSLELAKEARNEDYIKLNTDFQKKLK